MRIFFVITLLTATASAVPHKSHKCGEERADVKLGRDAEAAKLDMEPNDITVARLVALPRPGQIPESSRASDVERTVWRLEATVTAYKLETDGDFHVVIYGEDGHHMIIEIPDPTCAASGAWGEQVGVARAAFLKLLADRGFPAPGNELHQTRIPILASGLGFFDKLHGQTGVALSGIELHPVLSISIGSAP